ncbi:MAG: YicC/YloC family endoribonuclease [Gemmatimonadales bacterium]
MTGFGAADGEIGGRRIRIEIRAVNHRWFNLAARLPAGMAALESPLREVLRQEFARGHINVLVRWLDDGATGIVADPVRVQAVVDALREMQQRFHLAGELTIDLVARQAEFFRGGAGDEAPVEWSALAPLVARAAAACRAMRQREGADLTSDLGARLEAIQHGCGVIESLAPARLQRERARLRAEVRRLLDGKALDEWRLAQELGLIAERIDITEEVIRLRAHVAAAREGLAAESSEGKQLGFLAQEIGRELNTIGAKANDVAVAHEVVRLKGELEKFREQLENIE